jgi:aminopeptidase N
MLRRLPSLARVPHALSRLRPVPLFRHFSYFSDEDWTHLGGTSPAQRAAKAAAKSGRSRAATLERKAAEYRVKRACREAVDDVISARGNSSDFEVQHTGTGQLTGMAALAERQMVAAMRAGEFDNLAGKGKPLKQEHASSGTGVEAKILANANYSPPSFSLDKQAQADTEALARGIRAAVTKHGPEGFPTSKDAQQLRQQAHSLNGLVKRLNAQILRDSMDFTGIQFPLLQRPAVDFDAMVKATDG